MAVMAEASDFARMTFAQKKDLVRAKQHEVRSGSLSLSETEKSSCRESIWELDRIVYYLFQESKAASAPLLNA